MPRRAQSRSRSAHDSADGTAQHDKEHAFSSLNALLGRQGGKQVLYGAALAVAAALAAWSRHEGTPLETLTRQKIV